MADNRNVPMRKIIDEIIERYDFDEGLVDRTLIVKKIKKLCLKEPITQKGVTSNLWECSNVGKNKEHLFTSEERKMLVTHYDLCTYLLSCSFRNSGEKNKEKTDKKLNAVIELHDKVQKRIENETQALIELNEYSNEIMTFCSFEEVQKKKHDIMIEALFLRYFKPIDEELLFDDMETKASISGTNYTDVNVEESLWRLENPIEAYCIPKEQDK